MILHVVIFLLRVLLSESSSRTTVLQAVVGELFQINGSSINEFRGSAHLPDWICNSSFKYSGIPTMKNVALVTVNDRLAIDVKSESTFNRCVHRWPTLMVFVTTNDISALSGCERLHLWNLLQIYLPGPVNNLRLVENVSHLMRSLSILAQWKSHTSNTDYHMHSAVVSHIGCGFIPESMIDHLKYLEKEENVNKLSMVLSLPIGGWLVADHIDPVIIRKRRHSKTGLLRYLESSSVFYRHERQQKQEWHEARIIIEGSGLFDEYWAVNKTINKTTKITKNQSELKVEKNNNIPLIKKSLGNITVFVGSRKLYQIPSQAFVDEEDGYSRQLTMRTFLRSENTGRDELISLNMTHWIYFIQERQLICLQPKKTNVGQYALTVCAYDSDKNRICDGLKIFIKNQKPIMKNSHKIESAGGVWKYTLQENWADVVKENKTDVVTMKMKSSSLADWNPEKSTISLITEAYLSKEYPIKMIAESQTTSKTLIWTITVTTTNLNAYLDVTSPEIVLKFSFHTREKVPFDFINVVKDKLISAISKNWKIAPSISRDILLYRIISGKDVFLSNSTNGTLILSFVYSPKKWQFQSSKPITCSDVSISKELLANIKLMLTPNSKNWTVKMINLINIPGKCIFENPKISTTSRPLQPDPDDGNLSQLINKTFYLEVKNGFTFKKILFPIETVFRHIRSMQLFDSNNLVIDESSWVFLSNTQFAIYGIPLMENVRTQPYLFNLKVTFQSGLIQLIIVNIIVEKFVPKFSHKFGLIISISEKDTLELGQIGMQMNNGNSFRTMGQLLVSQNLSYRWQVVETLARYLNGDQCNGDCGTNIFVYSFSESKTWQVNISWSIVFNSQDSLEYPTMYSVGSCSDAKLKSYIRSLMMPDQVTESVISAFFSSVSTFQASPHQKLVKTFRIKHLGTPSWVTVESSGSCSDNSEIDSSGVILSSNISVMQGSIFALPLEKKRNFKSKETEIHKHPKIYFLNESICELHWFQLSLDDLTIYGLPLPVDIKVQTYFSLRILLEFGQTRSKLNYYISLSIKPRPQVSHNNHVINMTISIKQNKIKFLTELDFRMRIVKTLNGYFHPSCSLGNVSSIYTDFQSSSKYSIQRKFSQFCQKAEDIILHSIDKRIDDDNIIVDIIWSQTSVLSIENSAVFNCDVTSVQRLSQSLFQNHTSHKISQELISFFDNFNIGQIINVQLHLSRQCLKAAMKEKIDIPHAQTPKDISSRRHRVNSQMSTKIVLGVLFLIAIVTICICIAIYFIKRGLPSSFSRLTDKSSKTVALEDFNSGSRNPIKNPISSFTKKPKIMTTMDSIGPSFSNNSPKTPLLSQFSKDDSKSDKQMDLGFPNDNTTASYSYAVCHPQSPEPDMPPNNSSGISKQPATSNVIRNPAMMMGSRLNPYRNIPPPII